MKLPRLKKISRTMLSIARASGIIIFWLDILCRCLTCNAELCMIMRRAQWWLFTGQPNLATNRFGRQAFLDKIVIIFRDFKSAGPPVI